MTRGEEKRPVRARRIEGRLAERQPQAEPRPRPAAASGPTVNDLRELEAILARVTPDLEKAMDLTIRLILGRQKEAALRAWARQAAKWWGLAKQKGEASGQNFLAGLNLLTLRKYFLQESQRR